MSYTSIGDYGIIGDLHTVALVSIDGSIDWCCLPHFDSPSIFASILDARKGGRFKISPTHASVQKQLYYADTCVLDHEDVTVGLVFIDADAQGYRTHVRKFHSIAHDIQEDLA